MLDPARATDAGAAQLHPEAPRNTIYQWEIGNKAETEAAFKKAAHVVKLDLTNNRLIPNAMEPRSAAFSAVCAGAGKAGIVDVGGVGHGGLAREHPLRGRGALPVSVGLADPAARGRGAPTDPRAAGGRP